MLFEPEKSGFFGQTWFLTGFDRVFTYPVFKHDSDQTLDRFPVRPVEPAGPVRVLKHRCKPVDIILLTCSANPYNSNVNLNLLTNKLVTFTITPKLYKWISNVHESI